MVFSMILLKLRNTLVILLIPFLPFIYLLVIEAVSVSYVTCQLRNIGLLFSLKPQLNDTIDLGEDN